jgi:hypothetical protein
MILDLSANRFNYTRKLKPFKSFKSFNPPLFSPPRCGGEKRGEIPQYERRFMPPIRSF